LIDANDYKSRFPADLENVQIVILPTGRPSG